MRARFALVGALLGLAFAVTATPVLGAGTVYSIGSINDVSAGSSCTGDNAEVEQAVDSKLGYVYEEWMGCQGIGFARSTDGGRTFETPISLPDVTGSNYNSWDPAVAVGRSEERRVGEECRSRWSPDHLKKKKGDSD